MKSILALMRDLFYYGKWCLEIFAYLIDACPVEVTLESGFYRRTVSFGVQQDGVRRITSRFAVEDEIVAGEKYREIGGREWVRSAGRTVSTKKLDGTRWWFDC
jgi:hypothetical protein